MKTIELSKTQELLRTKTVILVLSSCLNSEGKYDPNEPLPAGGDHKLPLATHDVALLNAMGYPLPFSLKEIEEAKSWLKGTDTSEYAVSVLPASQAWRVQQGEYKGKYSGAMYLSGWEEITETCLVNPTINLNLSRIANLFGVKKNGKDFIVSITGRNLSINNGTIDEEGLQILRDWEEIAIDNEIELQETKWKGGKSTYYWNVKGFRYEAEWSDEPVGLAYPTLRFEEGAAMYVCLKYIEDKDKFGRVAIEVKDKNGNTITRKDSTDPRQKAGFGLLNATVFKPYSYHSPICRSFKGRGSNNNIDVVDFKKHFKMS